MYLGTEPEDERMEDLSTMIYRSARLCLLLVFRNSLKQPGKFRTVLVTTSCGAFTCFYRKTGQIPGNLSRAENVKIIPERNTRE